MKRPKCRIVIALFAVIAWALSVTAHAETRAEAPKVDPAATEILKRMTDFMGSLKQFSVHTQNTVEDLLFSGHRIDIDISSNVIVSRPNKLRAERRGDLQANQVFYYDGDSLTLYNPPSNVYATEPAPDTYDGLFKYMAESLGLAIPISDLIYQNTFPLLMQDVNMAAVIGKTVINGVKCDHLLFSRPGVDFQVWVAEGAIALPYKYVVTDTGVIPQMSISTFMSNWNLAPDVKDTEFTFAPPKDPQEINFMPFMPVSVKP